MYSTSALKVGAAILVIAVIGIAGFLTRAVWLPSAQEHAESPKPDSHADRVKISERAQKNLRLVVDEAQLTTYWRRISIPGSVIDRPGRSDRGIPAPVAGVVTHIVAVPGMTVRAGDEMFRLKIVSESFQTSQLELFKAVREFEIAEKELKRLEKAQAAVPNSKLLELQYQAERASVLIHAHRQDLSTRQLTPEQIARIEKGTLVNEVTIRLPERFGKSATADPVSGVEYEVQELKVNLGDYVQAGQPLAYIADHRLLYIEGHALAPEIKFLSQAVAERWPVDAEFGKDDETGAVECLPKLAIEYLGNTMDATGQTLPIYVPFVNPIKEHIKQGKKRHTGQFRPGQKVVLRVAIGKVSNVFVLPLTAVVREGPEAYVFRKNGDAFQRRPVHVMLEDLDVVVIENDGGIIAGDHVAHNAAAALNRTLKASQGEGGGGGHHHGHEH